MTKNNIKKLMTYGIHKIAKAYGCTPRHVSEVIHGIKRSEKLSAWLKKHKYLFATSKKGE